MENLKNFSQAVIEEAIAGALTQLTGDRYTVEIKSKEAVELSLFERNRLAFAEAGSGEAVAEREKIVFVLSKHTASKAAAKSA